MSLQLRLALLGTALVAGLVGGALVIGGYDRLTAPRTSLPMTAVPATPPLSHAASGPTSVLRTTSFLLPTTFTVPPGWEITNESPHTLGLAATHDGTTVSIGLVLGIATATGTGCTGASDVMATDLDGITKQLTTDPAFNISTSTPIGLDGHRARVLDIELAPTWTGTCPNSEGRPAAAFLGDLFGIYRVLGAGSPIRIVLVDLGDGTTLLISTDPTPASTTVAMPVIESIRFVPAPSGT